MSAKVEVSTIVNILVKNESDSKIKKLKLQDKIVIITKINILFNEHCLGKN